LVCHSLPFWHMLPLLALGPGNGCLQLYLNIDTLVWYVVFVHL